MSSVKKYYLFCLFVLSTFYSLPVFSQNICIQNGGYVECEFSQLIYFSNGSESFEYTIMKENFVSQFCSNLQSDNLEYCFSTPVVEIPYFYNSPVYSYDIIIKYINSYQLSHTQIIETYQICPANYEKELYMGSWVILCIPSAFSWLNYKPVIQFLSNFSLQISIK